LIPMTIGGELDFLATLVRRRLVVEATSNQRLFFIADTRKFLFCLFLLPASCFLFLFFISVE
jgi:hypothetical protein